MVEVTLTMDKQTDIIHSPATTINSRRQLDHYLGNIKVQLDTMDDKERHSDVLVCCYIANGTTE